jgi:hypothetical protein
VHNKATAVHKRVKDAYENYMLFIGLKYEFKSKWRKSVKYLKNNSQLNCRIERR